MIVMIAKTVIFLASILLLQQHVPAAEVFLSNKQAEIRGEAAREQQNDCIGSWEDEKTIVAWQVEFKSVGTFKISCVQAAEARSEGNGYDITITKGSSASRVMGKVVDTGSWNDFKDVDLGSIRIGKAGVYDIAVVPHPKKTQAVMNLRGLRISGNALDAEVRLPISMQRGIYFKKKKYIPEPLPTFKANRGKLPVPVLESNPEYLELYWKCWELAFDHFKKPEPEKNGFVSNYLDEAYNSNIFQWDTIFMVMFARYGDHVFPAVQSFDNFYCKQHYDGFIDREIRETNGEDYHSKNSPSAINPPLFSWAEMESYRVTGDKSRFALVLPVLERYVEWLETGRKKSNTAHGLFWSNGLGSGMDNTPRQGSGWVDMSTQMVMQYKDLSAMCRKLGLHDKAVKFDKRSNEIVNLIQKWMWNEEEGLFYDVDDQGEHVKWKTAGCFWPMLAGITTPEQEAKLIANLKDSKAFWRKNIFPTLAADQPGYDPSGGYWRGGVWAPTNYAIIRGLARQGHRNFAREATERYLDEIYSVFKKTGTVYELYAPDMERPGSGTGGLHGSHQARPDFVGWTGCGPIAMLIENVLGFEVQGANKHVNWDLSRIDCHGIRGLRFGGITADIIAERRDAKDKPVEITVVSDAPFTLEITKLNASKRFKVGKGKNKFSF